MENNPEHKHHPRTGHRHRSSNDYKGKNKSERRPQKSGGHKKKTERAMVVGASDIDSSSWYSSSSSSSEEKEVDASGRARTSMARASLPKAFVACPRARRMTQTPTLRMRWEAWRIFY
jgi:hypothetical protein